MPVQSSIGLFTATGVTSYIVCHLSRDTEIACELAAAIRVKRKRAPTRVCSAISPTTLELSYLLTCQEQGLSIYVIGLPPRTPSLAKSYASASLAQNSIRSAKAMYGIYLGYLAYVPLAGGRM